MLIETGKVKYFVLGPNFDYDKQVQQEKDVINRAITALKPGAEWPPPNLSSSLSGKHVQLPADPTVFLPSRLLLYTSVRDLLYSIATIGEDWVFSPRQLQGVINRYFALTGGPTIANTHQWLRRANGAGAIAINVDAARRCDQRWNDILSGLEDFEKTQKIWPEKVWPEKVWIAGWEVRHEKLEGLKKEVDAPVVLMAENKTLSMKYPSAKTRGFLHSKSY